MLPIETIICQINSHHDNALKQATDAVASAKTAGELLLHVKTTLGWIGVDKVLKSYGLKDIKKSLINGTKSNHGFDRPIGEPSNDLWYWGNDVWDDRVAYVDSLLKQTK